MGLRFGSPFAAALAAVSPPKGGVLGGDVGLTAATDTLVLTTASLAVGTWLVDFSAELVPTAASASDAMIYVALGTATATFLGPIAADSSEQAATTLGVGLGFGVLAVVTVAGTLTLRAYSTLAATVKALTLINGGKAVTGYTAVRIS